MNTPKWGGQVASTAGGAQLLYTGPANGAVARIFINNRPSSAGVANVGIELRIGGAGTIPADFFWEQSVAQGVPVPLESISVGVGDQVYVTADIVGVNFNISVVER